MLLQLDKLMLTVCETDFWATGIEFKKKERKNIEYQGIWILLHF